MAETPCSCQSKLLGTLRRRVLTQVIFSGADLDEARLSEEFGLSRTPLRELAGEGYAELSPTRGARVAETRDTTLRDFFLTAPTMSGAILRLAATHAPPA